jgi:hypothetical protein
MRRQTNAFQPGTAKQSAVDWVVGRLVEEARLQSGKHTARSMDSSLLGVHQRAGATPAPGPDPGPPRGAEGGAPAAFGLCRGSVGRHKTPPVRQLAASKALLLREQTPLAISPLRAPSSIASAQHAKPIEWTTTWRVRRLWRRWPNASRREACVLKMVAGVLCGREEETGNLASVAEVFGLD